MPGTRPDHSPRPAALFVNEGAGSAHSPRVRSAVELARRTLDADLHVTSTRDRDELRAFLDERLGEYRTVVVVGGDGSLGVAYNAVEDRPEVTLGYIPAGFGNATAHLLKLPRDPAALVDVLAGGGGRPGGRGRQWRGWAAAVTASLPDLGRRHRVRVVADGEVMHEGLMLLIVASTTPFYGRGLLVNPGARPDTGQLMARVYPGPAARLAQEAARWASRRTPVAPGVSASSLTITSLSARPIPLQADGDHVGEAAEWHFEVHPAAVRLIGKW